MQSGKNKLLKSNLRFITFFLYSLPSIPLAAAQIAVYIAVPAIYSKIAAVGRPNFVKKNWVKKGAVVIDVGINQTNEKAKGKRKLVGDVDYEDVKDVAAAITPVPGGVGPMTIACLLQNTVTAACLQNDIELPIDQ